MAKRQITMKDIAETLGVSVATVSRALKNSPLISEEQRKRIQDYAAQCNFVPNFLAANLRFNGSMQSRLIGVIMPQIAHYYFSTVLSGIEQEASKRGYVLVVAQSDERYEREVQICDVFRKNRVCGVIVSQAKDTVKYDHFQQLLDFDIPLVFYDRICTGINTNRVVVDDYNGAFSAVEHLIKCGCRRIAFYRTPMKIEITKNRYNGYRDALLKYKIPIDDSLDIVCDNRIDAEVLTPEILSRENRPDGFFAINDDTALGILYSAKRLGFSVPDDIQICGFSNGIRAISCEPMLTTVEQRGMMIGREAVDVLDKCIEGKKPLGSVDKRIVKTRLIVRGTTRKV
ncbi:MAG: LacI family DNA-binding transcriptional regulator [Bacteroidaceae bacterium]|nr:LacI family DNA-binding transcriptional regulator [Bacteroidaceae bacterium]